MGNLVVLFAIFGAQVVVNKLVYLFIFKCTSQGPELASERCHLFERTYDARTCTSGLVTLSEAMRLTPNRVLNLLCAVASVVIAYVKFGFGPTGFVGAWTLLMHVSFNVVGLTEWFDGEHEFAAGAFGALVLITAIVLCVNYMDSVAWDLRVAFIVLSVLIGVWFAAHPIMVRVHKSKWWSRIVSKQTSTRICDTGLIMNEDMGFGLFVAVGCLANV